jgi:hypothetical protein
MASRSSFLSEIELPPLSSPSWSSRLSLIWFPHGWARLPVAETIADPPPLWP